MSKDLVTILIVTLLTVSAWVAFELYHKSSVIYISKEIRENTEPLDPEINKNLLNELKSLENR